MTYTPEGLLAATAVDIGAEEFDRAGKPESVCKRHYFAARAALESVATIVGREARESGGFRGAALREVAGLLAGAADAPGPDQ